MGGVVRRCVVRAVAGTKWRDEEREKSDHTTFGAYIEILMIRCKTRARWK